MVQLFIFLAGRLRCAIPLTDLLSVIQMIEVTPPAAASRGMAGTINLHGRIIPVYSVQELLGSVARSPRLSDMLLIARAAGETVALWIDETRDVEDLDLSPVAAPEGDTSLPGGVTLTRSGIVLIADLARFLAHPPDPVMPEAIRALQTGEENPSAQSGEWQNPDGDQVRSALAGRAVKMLQPEPGITTTEVTEILQFRLAYQKYGIEMKYVREVILTGEITPVPGTPEFISGICAARGQIISLVDLRALLKIPEHGLTDLNRVIVMTDGKITFGILADTISGVGTISLDRVAEPGPDELPGGRRYLKGVIGGNMFILDGSAILGDPGIIVDEA